MTKQEIAREKILKKIRQQKERDKERNIKINALQEQIDKLKGLA